MPTLRRISLATLAVIGLAGSAGLASAAPLQGEAGLTRVETPNLDNSHIDVVFWRHRHWHRPYWHRRHWHRHW